jgi:hypothetical protein
VECFSIFEECVDFPSFETVAEKSLPTLAEHAVDLVNASILATQHQQRVQVPNSYRGRLTLVSNENYSLALIKLPPLPFDSSGIAQSLSSHVSFTALSGCSVRVRTYRRLGDTASFCGESVVHYGEALSLEAGKDAYCISADGHGWCASVATGTRVEAIQRFDAVSGEHITTIPTSTHEKRVAILRDLLSQLREAEKDNR